MARTTTSPAKLERLMGALDHYNRLDATDDGSVAHAQKCIRAQNELLDQCIACGMPHDASEFEFAARVVTRFLCEA